MTTTARRIRLREPPPPDPAEELLRKYIRKRGLI